MVCILVNSTSYEENDTSIQQIHTLVGIPNLLLQGCKYQVFPLKKVRRGHISTLLCYGYLKMPEVITINSAWACPTPAPWTCRRRPRQLQPGVCDHALWPVPITQENCSMRCPVILENCLMDRWCSTTWEYLFPVLWAAMECRGTPHSSSWMNWEVSLKIKSLSP